MANVDAAIDTSVQYAIAAVSHDKGFFNIPIPDSISSQLDQFANEVDPAACLQFLKGDDGKHAQELVQILRSGLGQVLKDDSLSYSDIPQLIDTVRLSIAKVTEIKDRQAIAVESGKKLAIPVSKFLLFTALKVAIPGGASLNVLLPILNAAFALVQQVVPK